MKRVRKRLTYANVMSSIAVFLVLGGATAIAADQLGKNSVGKKQLKANSVTAAKIKKNAVTGAKIKNGAVTGAKIKDGSLVGADINLATLGTVPNSATTDVIKGGRGTLALGQQTTIFTHGPVSVSVKCEVPQQNESLITARALISSSTDNTVFTSWKTGPPIWAPVLPRKSGSSTATTGRPAAASSGMTPPATSASAQPPPTARASRLTWRLPLRKTPATAGTG